MLVAIIYFAIIFYLWLLGLSYIKYRRSLDMEKLDEDLPEPECEHETIQQQIACDIQSEIFAEWDFASKKFGPFHSSHEGFAVLHEEFDELKAEVWKNGTKHPDRDANMRKEAVQVAAMALRFLTDCCQEKTK